MGKGLLPWAMDLALHLEEYQIRCAARAEIEKLKTDKIFIAQLAKLEEQNRNFYPEADMLEVDNLCEFYDKDKSKFT